jgi:hypothetical protein
MYLPQFNYNKITNQTMNTINLEYWKKRCELAEMYIEESACEPDETMQQLAAYSAWQHFKHIKP